MRVEFDTSEISDILELWVTVAGFSEQIDSGNVRALDNRRALLTNYQRTAAIWQLFLCSMTPIDGEPEFAALKAKVDTFKRWVNAELGKFCVVE